jgi:hypothetical protein
MWVGWVFLTNFIIKKAWQSSRCLRLLGHSLLQFSCILVDKAEQDMLTPYTLASMTNTWVLQLHPGIDHSLKGRHIISTMGAIKALEPVHNAILSVQMSEM